MPTLSDPPKSQRFSDISIQLTAPARAPGTLPGADVPCVPYMPGWLMRFDPLIHVHCPLLMLYFHRSFISPLAPVAKLKKDPPKSQRSPDGSVQLTARCRAPGTLPGADVPCVPYMPGWLMRFDPLIHVHCPLLMLYFHRSFISPLAP